MHRRRKPFEARLKHVAQWGDAKLPFQDARPRGAIGLDVRSTVGDADWRLVPVVT